VPRRSNRPWCCPSPDLYDGTIASGGNRYDTGVIAKWQFKEAWIIADEPAAWIRR